LPDEGANVFVATKTRCVYGFSGYKNGMEISYDPAKRDATLANRGLDFADALTVFKGPTYDAVDDRFDYGEERILTVGLLLGRMVIVVWRQRGLCRHIISMRKANDREQDRYRERLGESRRPRRRSRGVR
jgi:uncharacterized DUF497 family protein